MAYVVMVYIVMPCRKQLPERVDPGLRFGRNFVHVSQKVLAGHMPFGNVRLPMPAMIVVSCFRGLCDVGSRWLKFAFTQMDVGKPLLVTADAAVGFQSPFLSQRFVDFRGDGHHKIDGCVAVSTRHRSGC